MGKEKVFEDMGLDRKSICVRCVFSTTSKDYKLWKISIHIYIG